MPSDRTLPAGTSIVRLYDVHAGDIIYRLTDGRRILDDPFSGPFGAATRHESARGEYITLRTLNDTEAYFGYISEYPEPREFVRAPIVVTYGIFSAARSRLVETLTDMGVPATIEIWQATLRLLRYMLGDDIDERPSGISDGVFNLLFRTVRRHAIIAIAATADQHSGEPVTVSAEIAERLRPTAAEVAAGQINVKGVLKGYVETIRLPATIPMVEPAQT